jgi:spermidine synthase
MLIGFSAIIGQIVLMRELFSAYNGCESSLGIALAAWLFWTAVGSILSSKFSLSPRNPRRMVAALECLLGVNLPLAIWALRSSKSLFQTVPGELVGPLPVLLASLACMSLFCIFSGALFVAAAHMICIERSVNERNAASTAYLLEAAGSAVGGIIASLILLRVLSPFQIAAIVLAMNLLMACILVLRMSSKRLSTAISAATLLTAILLVAVAPRIEKQSRASLWRGLHLLASRDSIYGNLTVIETGEMRSLYENGLILANAPDEAAAEESVHFALLEHPAPKRVLLIGGGANGSVAQALRHPSVERIDLIELNPAVLRMANEFLPASAAPLDPRVHLHYGDARAYLNETRKSYDVIIVSIPDPQTAQLNRFYTVEFFRSAHNHLAPDGLLALTLRSSEETISPDLAAFLRCIQRTLQLVFPSVVAIPGETIHFFAAMRPGLLTDDPQTLITRLLERNLKTRYVSQYFIPYRMMPDRMEQVRDELQPLLKTPINRDFSPIAYYFNTILWSAQFKPVYADWLRSAGRVPFAEICSGALLFLLMAVALLSFAPTRGQRARAAACSMAATGFTLMALEIILLLAFQSIYGYLYHQLAILIALFMAGIAVGSWLGLRPIRGTSPVLKGHDFSRAVNAPEQTLALATEGCFSGMLDLRRNSNSVCGKVAATQLLLALSAPALMLLVSFTAKFTGASASWLSAQCLFPALAALCGVLGGLQFPLVTQLYEDGKRPSLGLLYAVDLLGGCAGALVLSGYLIPVFGFWRTAWLTAAVNLAPALMLLRLLFPRREQA